MEPARSDPPDSNQRTVAAYERDARDHAAAVAQPQAPVDAEALRRLADALPQGARVLDVGSGPGWDADLLESFGLQVHRTDVTAASATSRPNAVNVAMRWICSPLRSKANTTAS